MAVALREVGFPSGIGPSLDFTQPKLSDREYQNLIFMACGRNIDEFGKSFGINPRTSGNQRTSLFSKLGVSSSLEVVAKSIDMEVFDPRGITREGFDWGVFKELSEKERETLDIWVDSKGDYSLSNENVARVRGISVRTLGNQLSSLYRKLGIDQREEVFVHYYIYRNGQFNEEALGEDLKDAPVTVEERPAILALVPDTDSNNSQPFSFEELSYKPYWEMSPAEKIIYTSWELAAPLSLPQLKVITEQEDDSVIGSIYQANDLLKPVRHALLADEGGLRLFEMPEQVKDDSWIEVQNSLVADINLDETISMPIGAKIFNVRTNQWGRYLGPRGDGTAMVEFGRRNSKHSYQGTVPYSLFNDHGKFRIL